VAPLPVCLQASPYPVPNEDIGKNDYAYAGQACVEAGGFLPTAAQLIGAAARVKLASTIDDDELTAAIDTDATDGLKDRREMSGTLVTTQAGSSAAGSEGVSDGAKGDPKGGSPTPFRSRRIRRPRRCSTSPSTTTATAAASPARSRSASPRRSAAASPRHRRARRRRRASPLRRAGADG
jgi:hypothetical protein